jgi:hypothetical protein
MSVILLFRASKHKALQMGDSKLDDLREDKLLPASVYERKLNALEALKTSLLHQAFAGES